MRASLLEQLPPAAAPQHVVEVDAIPTTPNSKIDSRRLPPLSADGSRRARTPPRNDREKAVADIWAEVREVPEVGVHDSFFDLGGHSLLAMQLIGRLEEDLGCSLPFVALLRGATISDIAG